jgi:23S rRNA (pseudouridine1915-N3)-methyltransferase
MQIYLIAVGNKMPEWVRQGYHDYAKRLPRECELVLKEIPPEKRSKNSDIGKILTSEGDRILAAMPQGIHKVVLDVAGKAHTTAQLAQALQRWLDGGRSVALAVGGPEGLADGIKNNAHECWSLSPLTFPHPLVRIIVAEQLYRAWSLLNRHPYHRE